MMEWKEYTIGDLCNIKHGFAFKGEFMCDEASPYVLSTPGNFAIGGGFKLDKPKYYNGPIPFDYILKKGDLIVTMTDLSKNGDTLGYSALVPEIKGITILHNQRIGLVENINDEIVDKEYLYWIMRTYNYQRYIVGHCSGSTVKHTSPSGISSYPVFLPPLPEQKRIAAILSSIDDKIENNRKINKNLEEQAQALFKSWFVDFEPFKDGEFVDSELGMIPKGWKVESLTSIANYMNGLAMQKFPAESEKGSLPVLKIKELGAGVCDDSSDRCSANIKPEYVINDGDVIFSWSGTLLVDIWTGGKAGLNQHLFKVSSNKYPKWFYYMWTKEHLANFIHIAQDKAVTMGHIKRGHLEQAKCAVPDDMTMEIANALVAPIIETIITNRIESRRLAQLRETLLPKLMNGEIEA